MENLRAKPSNISDPVVVIECHKHPTSSQAHLATLTPVQRERLHKEIQEREQENLRRINKFRHDTQKRLAKWKDKNGGASSHSSQNTPTQRTHKTSEHHSKKNGSHQKTNRAVHSARMTNQTKADETKEVGNESLAKEARLKLFRFTNSRAYVEKLIAVKEKSDASEENSCGNTVSRTKQVQVSKVRNKEMAIERLHSKLKRDQLKMVEERENVLHDLLQSRMTKEKQVHDHAQEALQQTLRESRRKEEAQARTELKRRRTKEENQRYIAALEQRLHYKFQNLKMECPRLCSCSSSSNDSVLPSPGSIWEHCATNCMYYNNPQAYGKALNSIFRSLA